MISFSYLNLGGVYSRLGDHKNAIKYMKRAIKRGEAAFGPMHNTVAVAGAYGGMAAVLNNAGDYKEAMTNCEKSIKIRVQLYPSSQNLPLSGSYLTKGVIFNNQGHYGLAVTEILKALEIRLNILQENHVRVATLYSHLGSVYHNKGEKQMALDYFMKAFNIRHKFLGKNHSDTKESKQKLENFNVAEFNRIIYLYLS